MAETLICPNDGSRLDTMKADGHHGTAIILDQCRCCGGVWFDRWELFQLPADEVGGLATVDLDRLRCPSGRPAGEQSCPRCGEQLRSFSDPNIPANIQMLICDACDGFWLNHGEISGYAGFRDNLDAARDERLAAEYGKMLSSHSRREYWQGIENFGSQLGAQRDTITGLPLNGTPAELARIDAAQDMFYLILGTAARLLFGWL